MTPEQLERAITHYLDGTLPPQDVAALEERLESDAVARELLAEPRQLTDLLRAEAPPELDWEDLARDLSAVVTGSVDEVARAEDQKLNALLKGVPAIPAIRWDALAT